jgi:outer membrane protein OmpA-like peptidoglycan-associated protein
MTVYRFLLKLIAVGALLLALCSCGTSYMRPNVVTSGAVIGGVSGATIGGVTSGYAGAGIGAAVGSLVGTSVGMILESHYSFIEQLNYNGVKTIQTGDKVKFILPSDHFFVADTPQFNKNYFKVIKGLAAFINHFPVQSIEIAGYTDNQGSAFRNRALSYARAHKIMDYLSQFGLDTRLIYAVGYGSQRPMGHNKSEYGRRLNRRIEIRLYTH